MTLGTLLSELRYKKEIESAVLQNGQNCTMIEQAKLEFQRRMLSGFDAVQSVSVLQLVAVSPYVKMSLT